MCSPVPFIIGVFTANYSEVMQLPMETVYIFDIDKGTFLLQKSKSNFQDIDSEPADADFLPQNDNFLQLKNGLKMSIAKKKTKNNSSMKSVEYMKLFFQFISSIMQNCEKFVQDNDKNKLNIAEFVKSRPANHKKFFSEFMNSQMFYYFADNVKTHKESMENFLKKSEELIAEPE